MTQSVQPSSSLESASSLAEGQLDSEQTASSQSREEQTVSSAIDRASTLVVTHTAGGKILSLHWPDAPECQNFGQIEGESVETLFGPVAIARYLERVQQVVETQLPEEFQCVVRCGQQPISFDLLLSPLPNAETSEPAVIGVGRRIVPEASELSTVLLSNGRGRGSYYELLKNVTSSIRKTLDIQTIWEQTVNGLGEMLDLDRCLVCDYSESMQTLEVVAEYYQSDLYPCKGKTYSLPNKPDFLRTLQSLEPVISDFERGEDDRPYTVLTIATCYRSRPNSILVLQQPPHRPWDPFEIELIEELTDQVGTAIAHARLFNDSQELAQELRTKSQALHRTNNELMRKHDELEAAKRQAEEASRLKSDFLANTSHELRTPLNGMIGFLRLVLDDMVDSDEERLEFVLESHNSALHLLNLINDVLSIAKIEAGKMDLALEAVSVQELLLEVEKFMRPQIEQEGLTFDIILPATLDELKIYSDYRKLKQVLLNLVSNAKKFTHEGGITIRVELQSKPHEFNRQSWPGFVKISVEDTGIGVSLEKQDRLFQTFSQVDSARTRQYEGTGLGLVISKRLVEAMGGQVNFISMGEGLGSTVTLTSVLYQEPVLGLG